MTRDIFCDTSGFFALFNPRDPAYEKALKWMKQFEGRVRIVTTEWIIGETCTLFVFRKKPHLVVSFLDYIERSTALLSVNPDDFLLASAKKFIKQRSGEGYSFVDCISFCLMKERGIRQALTTDKHFQKAGFEVLLS